MAVHIARQPIFDANGGLHGYELLYRGGGRSPAHTPIDGDRATRAVLSEAITSIGLDRLTNRSLAFVNFTRSLLMGDLLDKLDPKRFIVEILEDVTVDDALIRRVARRWEQGYRFALDDYIGAAEMRPLLRYAQVVKVDFPQLDRDQRAEIARDLLPQGIQLLAEKVETQEDHLQALSMGYSLFQGYYLQRPAPVRSDLPNVQRITSLRAFQELSQIEPNFNYLVEVVRSDVGLTYKLLRHASTLQYYRGNPITQVREAMVRMGLDEIRNFLFLALMGDICAEGSPEQAKTALIRGTFAERTAARLSLGAKKSEAFLTGVFSMLSTLVEQDLDKLMDDLRLSQDVKLALTQHVGILYDLLCFATDYQAGRWDAVLTFITENQLDEELVTNDFLYAVAYADQCFMERPDERG